MEKHQQINANNSASHSFSQLNVNVKAFVPIAPPQGNQQ